MIPTLHGHCEFLHYDAICPFFLAVLDGLRARAAFSCHIAAMCRGLRRRALRPDTERAFMILSICDDSSMPPC